VTLHIHISMVTVWLLAATGALAILGPVLATVTGRWLEIGALGVWYACWALAAFAFVLAVGSLL